MSRGNWSVGATLAGLAALLTVFGLGLYIGTLNYPEEQRYQSYRYASDNPINVDPLLVRQSDATAFENREPCEEPKGHDESDLCAQWRAAKAAEESAFWTKWGFWITAAGIIGLITTIIQSRVALDRAREANSISRDNAKRQLRAYVTVSRTRAGKMGLGDSPFIKFTINNTGQTPARITSFRSFVNFSPETFDSATDLPIIDDEPCSRSHLGAGESFRVKMCTTGVLERPAAEYVPGHFLYGWGYVVYDDIFDETHHTYFRVMSREGDTKTTFCVAGNHAT